MVQISHAREGFYEIKEKTYYLTSWRVIEGKIFFFTEEYPLTKFEIFG